jgi:hypothetical protein
VIAATVSFNLDGTISGAPTRTISADERDDNRLGLIVA